MIISVDTGLTAAAMNGAFSESTPIVVQAVPADVEVPNASPAAVIPAAVPKATVEPVSGHLVKKRIRPGPIPMRLDLVKRFIDGVTTDSDQERVEFLLQAKLTPKEKSYIVNHPAFKALYDAKLFDLFMGNKGLSEVSREDIKLLEIIGRRVGASKMPATQVNVQVNNNKSEKKEDQTTIRVQK